MLTDTNTAGNRKQTILVVDDAPVNRAILADMLDDYEVLEAENGLEAIAAIRENGPRISLMLLDIVMPEMDGIEVLETMSNQGWINDIPVVMVSSESAPETIVKAYNLGATDFISRPFDVSIVRKRVMNTLMLYAKQAELTDMVESEIYKREKSVSMMVSVLSQIVEFRNGESGLHVINVNTLTELLLNRIAQKTDKYNLTPEKIAIIKLASSLHDIGKISIPEEVLNKPGRLTDEEFETMKKHSAVGAHMLKSLPQFEREPVIKCAHDICRWHHERYDGRGYPDGLVGEQIPISAQVVAVADVYDALTSKRVYKEAYSHEKSLKMILDGECGAFDPFLLECLADIAPDIPAALALNAGEMTEESDAEIRKLLSNAMSLEQAEEQSVSKRTIGLLDYERMKYNFYAEMSNEIQFEFTAAADIASIHDYSERKTGLPEIIHNPLEASPLVEVFGRENLQKLQGKLRATTIDNSLVQFDLLGTVNGESRWFHLDARAMWNETPDGEEYVGAIGKLVDIHESHARLTDLERKATTDSLTGLTNHAYARNVIASRMNENPENLFVLMVLDMDKFKWANDEHGHLFGDEVLKHLAGKLKDSVRDEDIVARVGGDEFLICLEMEEGDPKPMVERIYNSLIGEYEGFPISISMGVETTHGSNMTYDELFEQADNALYTMKRNGRGGYVYSDDERCQAQSGGSTISAIESDGYNGD